MRVYNEANTGLAFWHDGKGHRVCIHVVEEQLEEQVLLVSWTGAERDDMRLVWTLLPALEKGNPEYALFASLLPYWVRGYGLEKVLDVALNLVLRLLSMSQSVLDVMMLSLISYAPHKFRRSSIICIQLLWRQP